MSTEGNHRGKAVLKIARTQVTHHGQWIAQWEVGSYESWHFPVVPSVVLWLVSRCIALHTHSAAQYGILSCASLIICDREKLLRCEV